MEQHVDFRIYRDAAFIAKDLLSNLRSCSIDRPEGSLGLSVKAACLGTAITLPHSRFYLVDNALFVAEDLP